VCDGGCWKQFIVKYGGGRHTLGDSLSFVSVQFKKGYYLRGLDVRTLSRGVLMDCIQTGKLEGQSAQGWDEIDNMSRQCFGGQERTGKKKGAKTGVRNRGQAPMRKFWV